MNHIMASNNEVIYNYVGKSVLSYVSYVFIVIILIEAQPWGISR